MRTVLGVLCLAAGIAAMAFCSLYTDRAVEFFHLTGDNAPTLAVWLGIFIWLPLTIAGAALFSK